MVMQIKLIVVVVVWVSATEQGMDFRVVSFQLGPEAFKRA